MPENLDGFVKFAAGDLTVYVARDVLEKLGPDAQQMPFYIDCYGRFWLTFAEPWNCTEKLGNADQRNR